MSNKFIWQCLSIEAAPELVESIADVFTRYAAGNVIIASTNIEDEIDGHGKISGPMRVSVYLEANQDFERKKRKIEQAIAKPVVTSNQALVWHSLKLVGCKQVVAGYGSLFDR